MYMVFVTVLIDCAYKSISHEIAMSHVLATAW